MIWTQSKWIGTQPKAASMYFFYQLSCQFLIFLVDQIFFSIPNVFLVDQISFWYINNFFGIPVYKVYGGINFFGKDASARWKNKILFCTSYPKMLKSSKFKLELSIAQNSNKDWGPKKVTIYFPIFYLVKTSENILFFYLHFTWLCS